MSKKVYLATQEDIEALTQQINNKISVCPILIVTAPTGCTVTVANGDTLLEANEENGMWQFNLPNLGTWTITTSKDGLSTTKTVQVTSVSEYRVSTTYGLRYGYRIKKSESDPSARVEYLFDAVGLTPAHMDFSTGIFDYGDWADKWFVTKNRPFMQKSDGSVDYYLNPNNYDFKEDDTASDVSNVDYDGNAMAQIPLCWVKRYEENGYEYEIISNIQYDSDYKAYAHTRADGSIMDWFAWSMFGGSGNASKIRSLAEKTLAQSITAEQEITGCKANGSSWYTHTWSQRELIRTLLVLMGKSTNTQSVFGYGNCRSVQNDAGLLTTGTLKNMGQFYGYNDATHQVKVFHIEKFWGDQWDRTAGVIYNGGKVYVKMTPEDGGYRITDTTGYHNTDITLSGTSGGYISAGIMSEYGFIPKAVSGSDSTNYCDGTWFNNSGLCFLVAGACASDASALGGAFAFSVGNAPSYAHWYIGCGLSCEQPAA